MADNDDRHFVLENHTNGSIREFAIRTNGWSSNWLARPVTPQARQNLNFRADRPSSCVLMTRVVLNYGTRPGVGERVFEQSLNYCGMDRIHVNDAGLTREGSASGARGAPTPAPYAAAPRSFAIGQRVLARFQGGPLFYPATITMIRGASATVHYADGDNGTLAVSQIKPFDWRVGSRVHCTFAKIAAGEVFPGRIAQMSPQGAIQVRYDDGDIEWTTTRWCHSR